jgi:hypothetical protein
MLICNCSGNRALNCHYKSTVKKGGRLKIEKIMSPFRRKMNRSLACVILSEAKDLCVSIGTQRFKKRDASTPFILHNTLLRRTGGSSCESRHSFDARNLGNKRPGIPVFTAVTNIKVSKKMPGVLCALHTKPDRHSGEGRSPVLYGINETGYRPAPV